MTSTLSERENFFRMLAGDEPAYVPHEPSLFQMCAPSALGDRVPGGKTGMDWFGVHWTEDPHMPGRPMVTPNVPPVLEDIEDWESQIAWPDLASINWDACAKNDFPISDPNKVRYAFLLSGPFERLHNLMGFEGALCALVTDPDSCDAFFSKLCDFKIEQIRLLKKHYDIDMIRFSDDWGTQNDLMFQPDVWRKLIKPHVQRCVDATHELGLAFDLHSDGKLDRIIDDIVDMGIDMIDPVQPINDLQDWANRFKDKLIFMGGLDAQYIIDRDDVTEQEIENEVKEKIDLFVNSGARFVPVAISLTPNSVIAHNYCYIYGRRAYSHDFEDDIANFVAEAGMQLD